MRVLITGITGMVGSHLADYILGNHPDVEVHGLMRWRSPTDNLKSALTVAEVGRRPRLFLHYGDLTDLSSLIRIANAVQPDRIFHLAAQSFVPTSFLYPNQTFQTNAVGTLNLLEAVRLSRAADPLIHICSSSEVYGNVKQQDTPITEDQPFNPASPYGISKVAADLLGQQYGLAHGLRILRTRLFTHTGPRRGFVFAESSFAKQIVDIECSRADTIYVGNLASVRTWLDVRDAVKAYWLLLEKCPLGSVYNIGGDETMTVGDMLMRLIHIALEDSPCGNFKHMVKPSILRPADVTMQIPDSSSFRKDTGWKPTIPFDQTLRDLLAYHRRLA